MTNQKGKKKLRSDVLNYRFKEYSIDRIWVTFAPIANRNIPQLFVASSRDHLHPSPLSFDHLDPLPRPWTILAFSSNSSNGRFPTTPSPIPFQPLPRPWLFRTVMRMSFTRPLNIARNILLSPLKIFIEVRHNFQPCWKANKAYSYYLD